MSQHTPRSLTMIVLSIITVMQVMTSVVQKSYSTGAVIVAMTPQ
jgi:hypothetical protein